MLQVDQEWQPHLQGSVEVSEREKEEHIIFLSMASLHWISKKKKRKKKSCINLGTHEHIKETKKEEKHVTHEEKKSERLMM